MQASIRGVSGAWLEQRDPLDLMSAVQGRVGCSSSSLRRFIHLVQPRFRQTGSSEAEVMSLKRASRFVAWVSGCVVTTELSPSVRSPHWAHEHGRGLLIGQCIHIPLLMK